jgi:hypothetical protein
MLGVGTAGLTGAEKAHEVALETDLPAALDRVPTAFTSWVETVEKELGRGFLAALSEL